MDWKEEPGSSLKLFQEGAGEGDMPASDWSSNPRENVMRRIRFSLIAIREVQLRSRYFNIE